MNRKMILAATAVAALGVAAPGAQAAFPGENGPIYFGLTGDESGTLNQLTLGTPPVKLFDAASGVDGVEVSPDGKRVLYNADYAIWVADADGTDAQRLTPEGGEDYAPSWSPNGRTIVFTDIRDFPGELWTMNADGTNRQRLGEGLSGYEAQYSPDGTQIAYTHAYDVVARGRGFTSLNVVNADGTDDEVVADGSNAEWTPDGKALIYVDDWLGYGPLNRLDLAGDGEPVRLTSGDLHFRAPSMSPDGTKIVAEFQFQEPRRGGPERQDYGLATMNADGSGIAEVPGVGEAGGPDWSRAVAQDLPKDEQPPKKDEQQPRTEQRTEQQPAPAETATARSVVAPRQCGSRRYFTINVRGKRVRGARVVVNGKATTVKRTSEGFRARVDLRTLPKGRFTVRIRKTLKGGKTATETRRYRTCVPKSQS